MKEVVFSQRLWTGNVLDLIVAKRVDGWEGGLRRALLEISNKTLYSNTCTSLSGFIMATCAPGHSPHGDGCVYFIKIFQSGTFPSSTLNMAGKMNFYITGMEVAGVPTFPSFCFNQPDLFKMPLDEENILVLIDKTRDLWQNETASCMYLMWETAVCLLPTFHKVISPYILLYVCTGSGWVNWCRALEGKKTKKDPNVSCQRS